MCIALVQDSMTERNEGRLDRALACVLPFFRRKLDSEATVGWVLRFDARSVLLRNSVFS